MVPKDKKQPPLAPSDWNEFTENQEEEMQFEHALHRHFDAMRSEVEPPSRLFEKLEQIPGPQDRPHESEARAPWWMLWRVPALAGSLAALVALVWFGATNWSQNNNSHLIPKGNPITIHLEYARKQGPLRIRRKATRKQVLYPGDLLQFVYTQSNSQPKVHLMIVALQPSGEVVVLAPFQGRQSVSIQKNAGTFPQGESLEVGTESGGELFLALVSRKSFGADLVRDKVRKAFNRSGQRLDQLPNVKGPWKQVWKLFVNKRKPPSHR